MLKRMILLAAVLAVFISCSRDAISNFSPPLAETASFNDLSGPFDWAGEAVAALVKKGAVSGIDEHVFSPKSIVTREQFAKMAVVALSLDTKSPDTQSYLDVASVRWSFPFVEAAKDFFPKDDSLLLEHFAPEQPITREVACHVLVAMLDKTPLSAEQAQSILANFEDSNEIAPPLSASIAFAVSEKLLSGDAGRLSPKSALTRAEAAVLVYRAVFLQEGKSIASSDSSLQTAIVGTSTVSLAKAKKWAEEKGAHERFIAISELYWEYGAKTGIRPEVLYAQAAKETNYGKYTGNVIPEQNNWAGIKTKDATGDKTEDHESFTTPEDGVRAHFNHMAAYLGQNPVGITHDRYAVAASASFAGNIRYVEELGTHWAPAENYGYDIVKTYLRSMEQTVI